MNVNATTVSGRQSGHDPNATSAAAPKEARNPAAFRNLVDGRAAIDQGRQILDDARASAEENCRNSATSCGPGAVGVGLVLGFAGAFEQLTEWGDSLGDAVCDLTDCSEPDTTDTAEESEPATDTDKVDSTGVTEEADADAEEEAPADAEIVGRLPSNPGRDATIDQAWR